MTGAPGHLSQPRRPIPPPKPSPTIVINAPIISAIVFVIVITYSTATIVTMSVTIISTSITSSRSWWLKPANAKSPTRKSRSP